MYSLGAEGGIGGAGGPLFNPHVARLFAVADGTDAVAADPIGVDDADVLEGFMLDEVLRLMADLADFMVASNAAAELGATNVHLLPANRRAFRATEAELSNVLISIGAVAATRRLLMASSTAVEASFVAADVRPDNMAL